MAVQRRVNWISQQRVDVPDMRAVESAASNDWDQSTQAFVTNVTQGYIMRGFEISMAGAIGGAASNLQMIMDSGSNPSSVMHILASQSGTILQVPPGTPAQQLNSSINTNITGAFSPNALNYVGLDYTRYIDPTTDAQAYIWNPTTQSETTLTAPRAMILQYEINISTTSWASNFLPIAIVQTDASNNVVAITDCRWLLFRLGTGGADPNPFYQYPWTAQPEGRTENPPTSSSNSINPFEGGDKMLFSLKDWMNAVMTTFLEVKGTTYWYSGGNGGLNPNPGSLIKLREDAINTITVGEGTISHGVLPNSEPVLSTTASITENSYTMILSSTAGLVSTQTYFAFASGLPYGASFVYSGSSTVTLSVESTVTNPTASVNIFSPSVVTSAGQINWSDPFYLKVIGSALSYEIAANPSSTDIRLGDDDVAYIILGRDLAIAPNLVYTYNSGPMTTTVMSLGAVPWTSALLPGDFIRAQADPDSDYAVIYSVDSSSQVTLTGNYVPASQTASGVPSVYALGSYGAAASPSGPRNIYITTRELVPVGQNTFWLFAREDVGGVVPTAYVHFLGQELQYGDSNRIDGGIPTQLLQYIGSPSESTSKPQYASSLIPGSIPEITQITTGPESGMTSNEYFYIFSSGNFRKYYIWVNDNGTGVDPMPLANYIGVPWLILPGMTATQTAASLVTALNDILPNDFSATSSLGVVTVSNNSAGTTNAASNFNVGGLSISVTQAGSGPGNAVINDGDNLTLAIKKLDDELGNFLEALDSPTYDETINIVSSGGQSPPYYGSGAPNYTPVTLNGPISPTTYVTLPNNTRLGNAIQRYTVGLGTLEIYLNGQFLELGIDWLEVGASGAPSTQIEVLNTLVVGDYVQFRIGAGGGGGGGGGVGPEGPAGPTGPAGTNAAGGPVNISTKTTNYGVLTGDNVLKANCTGGNITFTLYPTAGNTGRVLWLTKIDSTANVLVIQAYGSDLITGMSSVSLTIQWESIILINDGTTWSIF